MLLRRGLLFFAAFSWLWAQAPAPAKKGVAPAKAVPAAKSVPGSKPHPAPNSASSSNKTEAKKEEAPKIDPAITKVIDKVAAKHKAMQSYSIDASIDSGRQVAEDPRQSMSKADIKFRVAPNGKYSLEVIEEAEDKLPYKVVSDGKKRWSYVAELKKYEETPATASLQISAAEPEAAGPLSGGETFAERLMRQLVPLLANVDKTTDNAFFRGRLLTLLSKPDAQGHTFLLYVTLASEEGDVAKVSWYQSSGPANERMLLRTDYELTSFKALDPAPADTEFLFNPPAGTAQTSGATASAAR